MTPAEERDILDAASAAIEESAREAQARMIELIRDGVAPRDAAQQAAQEFGGELEAVIAAALGRLNADAIGQRSPVQLRVGDISLSSRLYAEAVAVSSEVQAIVQQHVLGFQQARELALQLFEGYGFRPADQEPLKLNPREPRLPRYLRDLVRDDGIASEMERAFAGLQVRNLSTPALRAAYTELLRELDDIAEGKGAARLDKRLEVAFYERMRFFAARIAQTELHRAYMEREARLLMDDQAVEFLQVRRAPGRQAPCICTLFTGRDRYGLGPGVYPKALAPRPPFHPFCRCALAPRLDLTGTEVPDERDDEDRSFLQRLGQPIAARVMGSRARLEQVERGAAADDVAQHGRNPTYRVRTVGG